MNKPGRWRIGALASAIALLGSLASLEAHALALGRITVQSALGEPLRAEIDIADISADEASSLKAGVASAETFKAAGLEYNAAVAGLDVKLQRRADGRVYLRLTGSRPVNEPFVDLILQATWASGRITRDYTMLIDPPHLRSGSANAVEPSAPVLSRPATPLAAPIARATAMSPYPQAAPPVAKPVPVAKTPTSKAGPVEQAAPNKQVIVKAGDTASKIAAQNKPASVSLDQMLVALLRNNPDAFIGDNVNRIKSGAVLDIPGTQSASAISPGEATRTIVAQSKDFNAFRHKLADSVPTTQVASADRQAGGKLEAKLEDRAPASTTPDKLTLSKGAVQGKTATAIEEKIARDKETKDASSRMAELSKNISDLNKLSAAPGAEPATSPAPSSGAALPTPSSLAAPAPVAVAASAAVASADPVTAVTAAASAVAAPLAPASQPAAAAPVALKKPLVTAPPPAEPGLMDQLRENAFILLGAGGLLALLAGLGFSRYRQNKKKGSVDSSFFESRLQADSFFGASGGQRIDTSDRSATGSSLAYSASQLDAAGDVDPVAEADVYLAYGRDLQAEEILKEALRTTPTRVAIHTKLLEIYAKRLDSKAFKGVATDAFKLTQGYGPEWAYISELGRNLDPANPMYQAGGEPAGSSSTQANAIQDLNSAKAGLLDLPETAPSAEHPVELDLDLGLDFSLNDEPDASMAPASISAPSPYPPQTANPSLAMESAPSLEDLEFDSGHATAAQPAVSPTAPASPLAKASSPEIDFLSEGLDFTPEPFTAPMPLADAKVPEAPVSRPADTSSMLEFDMSSLSLDLGPTTEAPTHALTASPEDPLEIKFLLAEEFRTLGDSDGARSLADEVLAKASGPLKVKAQAFLNALS